MNAYHQCCLIGMSLVSFTFADSPQTQPLESYPIVATGQTLFFNNKSIISQPKKGESFYGQDAEFIKNKASYINLSNDIVEDKITGLMWQKSTSVMTFTQAMDAAKSFKLGGFDDWRLPNIKELYSLIDFSGIDASSREMNTVPSGSKPFINTTYFDFKYASNGTRIIDTQLLSSTLYTGKTMERDASVFGVNMADGRIKAYELIDPRTQSGKSFTVRFVRGHLNYGKNQFVEKNGLVLDRATHLMWSKRDSQKAMNWESALRFAQQKNQEKYLGFSDWRLPNAKELQSIVDYARSPQATHSAAIDPIFEISSMKDEAGKPNFPCFWSSTTHQNAQMPGEAAVYICFGEALGFFAPPFNPDDRKLMDVHGAGAQRSDPKTGNAQDFPYGRGPQGDVMRMLHYVRLVRSAH